MALGKASRKPRSDFRICEIEFFGDLSSSPFFVFWKLEWFLLLEFGDLTCYKNSQFC